MNLRHKATGQCDCLLRDLLVKHTSEEERAQHSYIPRDTTTRIFTPSSLLTSAKQPLLVEIFSRLCFANLTTVSAVLLRGAFPSAFREFVGHLPRSE